MTTWPACCSATNGDCGSASFDCEELYEMLNELEAQMYAPSFAEEQRRNVKAKLADALARIQPHYMVFLGYFRRTLLDNV